MNVEELQQIAGSAQEEREKFDYEVNVCMGTSCLSQHSDKIRTRLRRKLRACGKSCHVRRTGCMVRARRGRW